MRYFDVYFRIKEEKELLKYIIVYWTGYFQQKIMEIANLNILKIRPSVASVLYIHIALLGPKNLKHKIKVV